MVPHQILAVCLRAVAVLWFMYVLSHAVSVLPLAAEGPEPRVSWAFLISSIAAQLVGCALLWVFPFTIANKLLRASGSDKDTTPVSAYQWQVLILTGIGIWVLTRAVPDTVYWAVIAQANHSVDVALAPDQKAGIVATVVELAVGIALVVGSKKGGLFLRQLQLGATTK
jgi:hypothetical protein